MVINYAARVSITIVIMLITEVTDVNKSDHCYCSSLGAETFSIITISITTLSIISFIKMN